MTTNFNADELRRLAGELKAKRDAATGGEWDAPQIGYDISTKPNDRGESTTIVTGLVDDDVIEVISQDVCDSGECYLLDGSDREFIVYAANTVAPLVAQITAALDEIEAYEGMKEGAAIRIADLKQQLVESERLRKAFALMLLDKRSQGRDPLTQELYRKISQLETGASFATGVLEGIELQVDAHLSAACREAVKRLKGRDQANNGEKPEVLITTNTPNQ